MGSTAREQPWSAARSGCSIIQEDLLDVSEAFASNGITRPFLVVVGPAFGNSNPLVTYPEQP